MTDNERKRAMAMRATARRAAVISTAVSREVCSRCGIPEHRHAEAGHGFAYVLTASFR